MCITRSGAGGIRRRHPPLLQQLVFPGGIGQVVGASDGVGASVCLTGSGLGLADGEAEGVGVAV